MWLYNSFFGGHGAGWTSQAYGSEPSAGASDEGQGFGDAAGGDFSGDAGGGDFGGGDFGGGGDWGGGGDFGGGGDW